MKFKNFLNSGYIFTANEYELENKFILANALLLAMAISMFFFTYLMYVVQFTMYIEINLVTAFVSLLLIALLRIIKKDNLDIYGYLVFFLFMLILFYTYKMDPLHFPATSWFAILIIPSLVIHGHRFAFILSIIYFVVLLFFYEQHYGGGRIEFILIEFPPLFLTIWFVYFYHQRYKDSLHLIEEKHAYMMHQAKLASMGEMIENIAHQWRQPLSQINSSVLLLDGLLKQKGIKDTHIEEKLLEIESFTQYMSTTIDDFKNFFEKDKQIVIFSLDEVLGNVLRLRDSSLSKNNIVLEYIPYDPLLLKGYPNELQQVILVIINNAIDTFTKRNVETPKILISASRDNGNLHIQIEDNAGGIDRAIIDRIFDPYFTTKKESDGSGLGLYMSKMIIEESMNGSLKVENKNDGACFTIQIQIELMRYETNLKAFK